MSLSGEVGRNAEMPCRGGRMGFLKDHIRPRRRASRRCNYLILDRVASAIFDDPNLVSCAGLVPMIALAQQCDLPALADVHLSVPTDKGANAGAKVTSLVAGMVAGADSIEDMALLRHGAMGTLFDRPYAPVDVGFVPA